FRRREKVANLSTYTSEPSRRFNFICYDDDDDEERTIPLSEIISQLPPSIVFTTFLLVLPIEALEDSLIIGNEELSTIPKKESDEVIESNVEDLVSILKGKFVTFSNPLFNLNDDFTSSDDESLSDVDVPEDNVIIYSNPLFEFDDEYFSSDVNPLFDEFFDSRAKTSFTYDPNPNSFDDSQNLSDYPPQPQYETYHASYVQMILIMDMIVHHGSRFLDGDDEDDDYDKESIISTNMGIFETPPSIVITTSPLVLPIEDPEDSLIIGNEDLNTISKKELYEFIKSSVENLVPIPSESENTSGDDESLSDEDVPKDNVKIYSNPLFEFDDEYISSDVNLLFDEVLENIESKDSYDSNLDELDLLVTLISDANKDECFDSGGDVDEINDFEDGYYDSKGDILYLKSLLSDDTTPNLPPEDCLDFKDFRARGFVHRPLELQSLAYENLIS
nr:hypothetical protein [Tanacetum cinerariifolium]